MVERIPENDRPGSNPSIADSNIIFVEEKKSRFSYNFKNPVI